MFKLVAAIFSKEWKDTTRDRRTLASILAMVLGFPLLYGSVIGLTDKKYKESQERLIHLLVDDCGHLPELCDFLSWNGVILSSEAAEAEQALIAGKFDVFLKIPEPAIDDLEYGRLVDLQLSFHQSHEQSVRSMQRLEALLRQYQLSISARRMINIGISPEYLSSFTITRHSLSKGNFRDYLLGTLYISVLMMVAFLSALQYSNDSIAGERERGTLEALLNLAVPRWVLLLGKWLNLASIVLVASILSSLTFKFMGEIPVLQNFMGIYSSLTWQQLWTGLAVFLPILLFAPALQVCISILSRSLREAQTYNSILMLFFFLPTTFLNNFTEETWLVYLPIAGQALALRNIYRETQLDWQALLSAELLTLLLFLLVFAVGTRLLKSESVLKSS